MSRLPDLGPRGEGWVVIQFVLLACVALAGLLSGPAWDGDVAAVTSVVGLALMGFGALLLGRGLLDLGRNLTPVPYPRDEAQLVVAGVYAHVRHPIYGGLIVTAFGWSLASASLPAMGATVGLVVFFWLKSAREEAWLSERFGNYGDYAARTKRFLPYLL